MVQKRTAATATWKWVRRLQQATPVILPTGQAIAATGCWYSYFNQSDNSQVKLYNDSAYTAIDAEGKAEMKFIARYVATNATVTAGTANADSQFTVEYKK